MTSRIEIKSGQKPPQYVLRFVGKVSWEGRSNGLPDEVYAYAVYEGDNSHEINSIIEAQVGNFIRWQAIAVQKDQGKIIDMRQAPAERMLIPFKWIVNISTEITKLTGELSEPDENGVERLSDGSEPLKQ
jgi:hypothetical protein